MHTCQSRESWLSLDYENREVGDLIPPQSNLREVKGSNVRIGWCVAVYMCIKDL